MSSGTSREMVRTVGSNPSAAQPFSRCLRAGTLAFASQSPEVHESDSNSFEDALARMDSDLRLVGFSLNDVVWLIAYAPNYKEPDRIAAKLDDAFGGMAVRPTVCVVGVASLDASDRVRVECMAAAGPRRHLLRGKGPRGWDDPAALGLEVDDFLFLPPFDAKDDLPSDSDLYESTERQTIRVFEEVAHILTAEGLSFQNVVRNFAFLSSMGDPRVRAAFNDARDRFLRPILEVDRYPPNSRVGVKSLGPGVLLRDLAFASRRELEYVASTKVRTAPGRFAQAVRVGSWLFLAGADFVDLRGQTLTGPLEMQVEHCLTHIEHVIQAAGGSIDDLVKTTVYLVEGQDESHLKSTYGRFLQARRSVPWAPSGIVVGVDALRPGCLVEIDSVAYLG